jgi:hypothetical protein
MAIHLFPDFLENKKTYSLNVEHWSQLLNSVVDVKSMSVGMTYIYAHTLTATFNNGNLFMDGNPIFDAVINNYRAIRIIQQEPTDDDDLTISAWIDKREFAGKLLDELVIDLELTEENQTKAILLLKLWLNFNTSCDDMMVHIDNICATTNVSDAIMV